MNVLKFAVAVNGWAICTLLAMNVSLPAGLTLLSLPVLFWIFK